MPIGSRYTSAEAEAVQNDLLRRVGPARRFALAFQLSDMAMGLARRALRRADPLASELEIDLRSVELHHDRRLAERLRAHLAARAA